SAAVTGDVPAAPAPEQRPRTRPAGAARPEAPVAARERDPEADAPAGASAGARAGPDKPLERPRDETAGPDLETLYERVGQKLATLEGARGKDAATPLWALYRSIPLADALRTP